MEDLFAVLGRNQNIAQLENVDFLSNGVILLEASLEADPLDVDKCEDDISTDGMLEDFSERVETLDLGTEEQMFFSPEDRKGKRIGHEEVHDVQG